MKMLYFLFPFFFVLACVPPPENVATIEKRFRTTAPSALYFKNIRSINYSIQEDAKTRIEYYQLKKTELTKTKPHLLPRIANDWLNDAAYIQLQAINLPSNVSLQIAEENISLQTEIKLNEQTEIAIKIKNALEKRQNVTWINPEKSHIRLFESEKERGNFLIVMQDYLRLTENAD